MVGVRHCRTLGRGLGLWVNFDRIDAIAQFLNDDEISLGLWVNFDRIDAIAQFLNDDEISLGGFGNQTPTMGLCVNIAYIIPKPPRNQLH
jgi:hypothetical protein